MIDWRYEVEVVCEAWVSSFTVNGIFHRVANIACYWYSPFWDVVFLNDFFHYCYRVKYSCWFASVCILVVGVPWVCAGGVNLVCQFCGLLWSPLVDFLWYGYFYWGSSEPVYGCDLVCHIESSFWSPWERRGQKLYLYGYLTEVLWLVGNWIGMVTIYRPVGV